MLSHYFEYEINLLVIGTFKMVEKLSFYKILISLKRILSFESKINSI